MKCVKSILKQVSAVFVSAALLCMMAFTVMAEEKIPVTVNSEGDAEFAFEATETVHLYTYTVYDAAGANAGTIELRYGWDTGWYGIRLWITANGSTEELENDSRFFNTYSSGLQIKETVWTEFFKEKADAYTYTVTSKELPAIPSPASVTWDSSTKPGIITWGEVAEADGRYVIIMSHGNKTDSHISTLNHNGKMDLSDDINESGSYVVSVMAVGGKNTGNSAATQSAVYEYVMPEEILGETNRIWWTKKTGETIATVINWNPVPGAGGYEVSLKPSDSATEYIRTIYNWNNKQNTSCDWSDDIKRLNAEYGSMTYTCTVRALAGNIEVVANAPEDSTLLSENNTTDEVKEIGDALAEADASNVLNVVKENGVGSVAIAMQSDKEILDKVAKLEDKYTEANGIDVKAPNVTHPKLDASRISAVGAGINAVTGSSIGLNFSQLPGAEEEQINDKLYKNAVQVSITLENNEEKVTGELKCPIAITMPVPKGIDLNKLVILHYHADGNYEIISPAHNADGTVTFSVTSFSTFVFAEEVVYNGSDNSGNTGNNDNNHDEEDDGYSYSSADSESSAIDVGVQTYGTTKKYVKSNGQFAKNEWVNKGITWYYAGADGVLQTGWYQNAQGTWYYLKSDCAMATGWQMVDGKWYYLDAVNGDMKKGWLQTADGKWYFLNADGDMKLGWLCTADGKWYYLGADGACLMNTTTPDGYQVDANGVWVR